MTVPFYLFLPSGIRGVMEIIYQLMWADGLIKPNRKAFSAGPECVTDSWGGTLGITCQMCPRGLPDLLHGPQALGCRVTRLGIQDPDLGSRLLLQPPPEPPGLVAAHMLGKASDRVCSLQVWGQQLQKELALLDSLPGGWLGSGCSVFQGIEAKILPSGYSLSGGAT